MPLENLATNEQFGAIENEFNGIDNDYGNDVLPVSADPNSQNCSFISHQELSDVEEDHKIEEVDLNCDIEELEDKPPTEEAVVEGPITQSLTVKVKPIF